ADLLLLVADQRALRPAFGEALLRPDRRRVHAGWPPGRHSRRAAGQARRTDLHASRSRPAARRVRGAHPAPASATDPWTVWRAPGHRGWLDRAVASRGREARTLLALALELRPGSGPARVAQRHRCSAPRLCAQGAGGGELWRRRAPLAVLWPVLHRDQPRDT